MISSRQDQTVVTANQFYDIYFITTKYICHFNNVGPSGAAARRSQFSHVARHNLHSPGKAERSIRKL